MDRRADADVDVATTTAVEEALCRYLGRAETHRGEMDRETYHTLEEGYERLYDVLDTGTLPDEDRLDVERAMTILYGVLQCWEWEFVDLDLDLDRDRTTGNGME